MDQLLVWVFWGMSSDKIFVSSYNTPIGYVPPAFPSLSWPLGAGRQAYSRAFIYDRFTIWAFTVYWMVFFFIFLHLCAGILASTSNILNRYRRNLPITKSCYLESVSVIMLYLLLGGFKGFAAGAIVGLLLGAIYRAGDLNMSTWIPFSWGIAGAVFDICSSYSYSSVIM